MPVRKQDAYRALELLEEYYNRLESPEDKPLKNAIDRVIKVFKSRLFQALIEIQEFYESILLDEESDRAAKINATLQLANEWDKTPLLKRDTENVPAINIESSTIAPVVTDNSIIDQSTLKQNSKRQPTPTPFSRIAHNLDTTVKPNATDSKTATDSSQFNYTDHWKEIQVELHRVPGKGLGFSIAGGVDAPCINDSSAVFITRITDGGIAHIDGHLKLHDIILRVNNTDFTQIDHQEAVESLKAAETPVTIRVQRLEPPSLEEIQLEKPLDGHLGFSIAGGISHEYVKGDYGIFITNIIQDGIADKNGRLKVGDRLMCVQSMKNVYDLEFVEHKCAVSSIRYACSEGHLITLIVAHPTTRSLNTESKPTNTSIQNQITSSTQISETRVSHNGEHGELSPDRRVTLRRGPNGFGFNIISSENGLGSFISFIQSGGPADKSKELRRGDRILSVNSIDLQSASHEEAGSILKNCGDVATIHVVDKYDDFMQCHTRNEELRNKTSADTTAITTNTKTPTRRQFYVRAEFDYDPLRDPSLPSAPGLAFHAGDILLVTNAVDDSWWQAKRTVDDREEVGIIPSKSRVEKKERARQKRVNFNQSGSRSNTPDSEKKKRKKLGLFHKGSEKKEAQSGEDTGNESETFDPVPSYQLLAQHQINYARPVVIFGPFKEIINDQLITDHPETFANCVPHTTRPKREKESDGREYHFVKHRKQMEEDIQKYLFIEAGEYGGNLYGTSASAVRDVANASKHCVLDVSGRAIPRLIRAGLYPIVLYVKPRDVKWIMDNMGEEANEERAKLIFEKCNETERLFEDLFTEKIQEENLADAYDRVLYAIDRENKVKTVWIPSEEKF